MENAGVEPDLTSYEYLVKMFCQELDIEEAEKLIDIMVSK
jgi:pentatricopeptide repeat protein